MPPALTTAPARFLLASESAASEHGLQPKARFVASAVAGVAPRLMGMGPVPATQKALAKAGLTIGQMDIVELNEAFAAQGLAVLRHLGVADDDPRRESSGRRNRVGPSAGCQWRALTDNAPRQLQRTRGRYALCTMCIGVGQGIALIVERV